MSGGSMISGAEPYSKARGSCKESVLSDELRDELGADAFEVDCMFAHRQIVFQPLLVHAAKRTQKVAQTCPYPFESVTIHFPNAITILV